MADIALPLDTIPEDKPHKVELDGEPVVLLRHGAVVRAFEGLCPHVGAPLENGVVCDGRLICPWHKAHFDVTDGAVLETPALVPLKRFRVTVADGIVRLDGTVEPALPGPAFVRRDGVRDDGAQRVIAVIGSGAAAAAALGTLRERGHEGRVVAIGPEWPRAPYDRTALSKMVISGQVSPDSKDLRLPDGALARPVERIGQGVRRIDVAACRIELEDGASLDYDAALLATGGTPLRPDLPGVDLAGVHVLRDPTDAAALVHAIERSRRAVIVGNSFIALETASGLVARKIETSVVGRNATPFAAVFGSAIGTRIRALHEENGVRFATGTVAAIEGVERVERVRLADGSTLDADLVLLATGVRLNTGIVKGLALAEDGAVPVDAGLRAADGLWAAGDIAQFPYREGPIRVEHWAVATQHGRVAARNMLGETTTYDGTPFFWTAHHGKRFDYLGHAAEWDETVIDGDLAALAFVAFHVRLGQVVAAIGCGRDAATMRLSHAMRRRLTLDEARTAAAG